MKGIVVKQISNLYTVSCDGKLYECGARGKFRNMKLSPLVGDYVEISENNKIIEKIYDRKNELHRPVVANIDIALIVTSVKEPDISLSLLDKELTVVVCNNIKPVICFTKLDLLTKASKKDLRKLIKYYKSINIDVVTNKNLFKLKRILKNKVVVLTGQTGAGKSSLLNKLDKSLKLETSPISKSLNRGVHTTRHTEIFNIKNIYFVDTPGFSSLDLKNITKEKIRDSFPEFKDTGCKFKNCFHDKEKGCKITSDLSKSGILPSRYINYIRFLKECYEGSSKLYK